MNELYDVLKTSKASDFLIREEQTESREAFFIGQKLDMSRAKKVTHTFLTVFVDSEDGKFRGSAEKEIHQGISREEMKQEIDQALFAAQFVQNPWYPVAEPSDAQASADTADASRDLTAELVKLVQAMQEIKAEEDSRVNSYEIFVNQKQTHIRNSRGVDVTFSGFDCEIEVVTNSRKDDHEIEIYKDLRFSDKSAEKIIAEVRGMFHTGRQRLNAVPTRQNEHADVLLTGNAVGSFFQYFAMHTNASYQYMVLPASSLEQVRRFDLSSFKVISNTSQCQAVQIDKETYLLAMYDKGEVILSKKVKFESDRRGLFILRINANGWKVYASDPTQRENILVVAVNGEKKEVKLPDGELKGTVIQIGNEFQ